MTTKEALTDIFDRLLERYGPQHWWPGETRIEIIFGAVLTQNTTWANVEKAIGNLKAAGVLSPRAVREIPLHRLARLVYPSGYYNAKARKLKAMADYLGRRFDDDLDGMETEDMDTLREELLAVHGVGDETADDVLLYAMRKPAFVIDAFTRRIMFRLGLAGEKGPYSMYRELFTAHLPPDTGLFGEYHALLVAHAKRICRKRPLCEKCCLLEVCTTGKRHVRNRPTSPRIGVLAQRSRGGSTR